MVGTAESIGYALMFEVVATGMEVYASHAFLLGGTPSRDYLDMIVGGG